MRKVYIIILFTVLTFIVSNLIQSHVPVKDSASDWQYSDVRYIDPVDTIEASPDIIAVLSRQKLGAIQVRIDFVDLEIVQDFSMLIYIDSQPGGNLVTDVDAAKDEFAWEHKIEYDNIGRQLSMHNCSGSPVGQLLRVTRDIVQDNIVISIASNNKAFDIRTSRILVILKSPINLGVIDYTSPILLSSAPPPPLYLELMFWNIMDSSTPATILRSWAGAHTGPQSSRHGLSYLFSAIQQWQIPVEICDFYRRDTIFALNYLQKMHQANSLIADNLLQNEYCNNAHGYAQRANLLFSENAILLDQSALVTYLLEHYFLNMDKYIMLGGDFSKSVLGDPGMLEKIFSYLIAHPWIKVAQRRHNSIWQNDIANNFEITQNNVPNTVNGQQIISGMTNLEIQELIKAELTKLPVNNFSRLASVIYRNILESNNKNILLAPGSYLSQIGHVIEAAYWAERPEAIHSCNKDIDWDGQPECILATVDIFLSFELEGGYLVFGFVSNENGYHQIFGPTTQFDVLRSDPSMLNAEQGIAGDGGQILGAFADPVSSIQTYTGSVTSRSIVLTSQDENIQKAFSIMDGEIQISLTIDNNLEWSISKLPIVLDPWLIYVDNPANIYWEESSQNNWIWGVGNQVTVGVKSSIQFLHYSFDATYGALSEQEDPNFDYTIGHLLPIPMAVAEFQLQPTTIIIIKTDS